MTAATLTLTCPSKLNLFLHITGRRPDGYHELQTLFQLLDHGDRMRFTPRDDGRLALACNEPELAGHDNLALRAARLLRERSHHPGGASIELDKRIAAGAGLGGGSANAAATLLALNHLWQLEWSLDALASLALELGADVPVFVHGHSAWAEGIGERLEPVTLPGDTYYLVLVPACRVSTGTIFSHRQLTRNAAAIRMTDFLAGCSRNDCQELVRRLHPEVDAALDWLARWTEPRLTGTGAGIFGAFTSRREAESVLARLPEYRDGFLEGTTGFVARGISRWSPEGLAASPSGVHTDTG